MITRKQTRKYTNLEENPRVSLLVDTRQSDHAGSIGHVQALTVTGTCVPLSDDAERNRIVRKILTRHPHLEQLAKDNDAEILAIRIESFLLLEGALDSHFVSLQ